MEENKGKIEPMKPIKLISVASAVEADMIVELLDNNGIANMKKQAGSGSYMNLYYGFSVYGAEIYVDELDYEKATELMKEINLGDADTDTDNTEDAKNNEATLSEGEKEEESKESNSKENDIYAGYPFYQNPRIIARILVGICFGSFVLIYLIDRFVK